MLPTYRPSKRKRARMVGFRKRNSTKKGKLLLKRRIRKGRWQLTPVLNKY